MWSWPNLFYAATYPFFRRALFAMDAERGHDLALDLLDKWAAYLPACRLLPDLEKAHRAEYAQWGLTFPHRVGLAAGLDKNARCLRAWQACGFGFVEVGTVTPKPQEGNEKPRLFRYPEISALVNRMGFNNAGASVVLSNLMARRSQCAVPVGVNIGKNKDTPLAEAVSDYVAGYRMLCEAADYVTVNLSSPNTMGLRDLQTGDYLKKIIEPLKKEQAAYRQAVGRYVPIWVKLAPDLSAEHIYSTCTILSEMGADAIVATNTTVQRPYGTAHCEITGGLSGSPLYPIALQTVEKVLDAVSGRVPVVAVGGIDQLEKAQYLLHKGAALLQLYTAFIYKGPAWLAQLVNGLHYTREVPTQHS